MRDNAFCKLPQERDRSLIRTGRWIALIVMLWRGASVVAEPTVLADFSDSGEIAAWQPLHDSVMGGRSEGELRAGADGAAVFTGTISLANRGGFASVRGPVRAYPLQDCRGVVVEARGDARAFQLRLRIDDRYDGIAYRAFFEPSPDRWRTFILPFETFVPVFRGRVLGAPGELDPRRITRIGLMLADKVAGAYRLEIRRILGDCG